MARAELRWGVKRGAGELGPGQIGWASPCTSALRGLTQVGPIKAAAAAGRLGLAGAVEGKAARELSCWSRGLRGHQLQIDAPFGSEGGVNSGARPVWLQLVWPLGSFSDHVSPADGPRTCNARCVAAPCALPGIVASRPRWYSQPSVVDGDRLTAGRLGSEARKSRPGSRTSPFRWGRGALAAPSFQAHHVGVPALRLRRKPLRP